MTATTNAEETEPTSISILEMSHEEAREFFLEHDSYYCSVALPPYIKFHQLLQEISLHLKGEELSRATKNKLPSDMREAKESDSVNYHFLCHKNSKYDWRKLQLINPALYVSLVNAITTEESWKTLIESFTFFSKNENICCFSKPVKSISKHTNSGEQISIWVHKIEKKSIELSLYYKYLIQTDIANCYSSIYTHSIAWAIHGKEEAKEKSGVKYIDTLIGNKIDHYIQCMNNGQTNGIPEGSVLMDFIAEIILGYADSEISEVIKESKINDYQILRYRDDYRIFVNNPKDGDEIIKIISEVLSGVNMKLNISKTTQSEDLITDSVKADKLSWIANKQYNSNPYKYLMLIYSHAKKFPNAGGLKSILDKYSKWLEDALYPELQQHEIRSLISIAANIACNNSKLFPMCARILTIFIKKIDNDDDKINIMTKIQNKFDDFPHSGHIDMWLQRMIFPLQENTEFQEPICKLIKGDNKELWDNDWISNTKLKNIILSKKIIDGSTLSELDEIIDPSEYSSYTSY